jgi:flagellar hook-length control protein FliK
MNSFAALMGSLTGAGMTGSVGMGTSEASEGGLFAGMLEASIAAKPLNGETAGAGLKATLGSKDGASAPGTIDLATLMQATTDAEGNIVPTGIPVEGAPPIPIVQLSGHARLEPAIDGGTENDTTGTPDLLTGAAPEAPAAPQQAAELSSAGNGEATPATAQDGAAETAQQVAAPTTPSSTQDGQPGRDTAPGQQLAAADRPEQLNAATAAGLNGATGKPGAAQPPAQPAPAAPLSSLDAAAETVDPQQAAKAAHIAANEKSAEATAKRTTALPAETDGKSRADLTKPVEIARTITLAPNGQTVLQVIKSGKTDSGPAAGLDQSTTASVNVRSTAAPLQPGPQQPQVPLNGIAVHIAQQAANGARRFDIRLDPPELGRVEVRLDVSKDGKVSTHLVVERSETLDLLQRDARALERALQNAGLDTSDCGMKFSLKEQGNDQAHSGPGSQSHAGSDTAGGEDAGPAPADIDNAKRTERRYLATGGLDIRI